MDSEEEPNNDYDHAGQLKGSKTTPVNRSQSPSESISISTTFGKRTPSKMVDVLEIAANEAQRFISW